MKSMLYYSQRNDLARARNKNFAKSAKHNGIRSLRCGVTPSTLLFRHTIQQEGHEPKLNCFFLSI